MPYASVAFPLARTALAAGADLSTLSTGTLRYLRERGLVSDVTGGAFVCAIPFGSYSVDDPVLPGDFSVGAFCRLMAYGYVVGGVVDPNPGGYPWPFWLRAETIGIADEATVTLWEDQGTGGTDAVAGGADPTYEVDGIGGKPSVAFAGHRLVSERDADTLPRTLVTVVQFDSFATFPSPIGNCSISGTQQNGGRQLRANTSGVLQLQDAVAAAWTATGPGAPLSLATPYILAVTVDAGGNYAFYVNGAAAGTGSGVSFTAQRETWIGQASGDTGPRESMSGLIGDILEADAVLTGPELAAVFADLGDYWGIAV